MSTKTYRMRSPAVATSYTRDGVRVRLLADGSARLGAAPILPAGSPEHHGRILVCRAGSLESGDMPRAARLMGEVDRLHESETGFPGAFLLGLMGVGGAA